MMEETFSLRLWFFFFKQKTAYEVRISDWSSDVCSSDLAWLACCRTCKEIDHGSCKAWRHRPSSSQENHRPRQGLLQCPSQGLPRCQPGRHQGRSVRLYRPQAAQASVPRVVDRPHQCRCTHVRPVLQPPDQWPEQDRTSTRLNSSH